MKIKVLEKVIFKGSRPLWIQPMSSAYRTSNKDYIEFRHAAGCSSIAGRKGGAQSINLAPQCAEEHILIHEVYFVIQNVLVIRCWYQTFSLDFACSGFIAWASTTGSWPIYWCEYDSRHSISFVQAIRKGIVFSDLK